MIKGKSTIKLNPTERTILNYLRYTYEEDYQEQTEQEIADELSLSKSAVKEALAFLHTQKLIKVIETYDGPAYIASGAIIQIKWETKV